jgi:hypothetical protein
VLLKPSRQSADSPQVLGSETLVYEPPVEPAQQDADAGLGHPWIASYGEELAVVRSDGFGHAQVGVVPKRGQPGHLGTNRVPRVHARSVDAQEIWPVPRIDPEGRVVLVALEGELGAPETVCSQGRSPEATKPTELPAPAQ